MIELGARLAMALQCETSSRVTFDRKHYFYPDTPKNYQITQHSNPIGRNGRIALPSGDVVGISRIQIEEDTAKVIYTTGAMTEASRNMVDSEYALLDFNRAGVALLEVVSKPDVRDAAQAVELAREIQAICRFLNVSNCNMEEGSMRLDVNLSLKSRRPSLATATGSRVEVKNLNSFRAVQHAIEYEIVRQASLLSAGEGVRYVHACGLADAVLLLPLVVFALMSLLLCAFHGRAETKMWDEFSLETTPLRVKHGAEGYHISPEPNIPPIDISAHLPVWRSELPELPHDKRQRYRTALGLKDEHVRLLTRDPATSRYFEEAAASAATAVSGTSPTEIAEWIVGAMEGHLHTSGMSIADVKLKPAGLAQLLKLVRDGSLTLRMARQILPTLMRSGEDVLEYVKAHNCFAITDRGVIKGMVHRALQGEEDKVQQYRHGATRLWGYFVGKVMQEADGRADPNAVQAALKEALAVP